VSVIAPSKLRSLAVKACWTSSSLPFDAEEFTKRISLGCQVRPDSIKASARDRAFVQTPTSLCQKQRHADGLKLFCEFGHLPIFSINDHPLCTYSLLRLAALLPILSMSQHNSSSQDRDTDSVSESPSPPPWAFEPVYGRPLPVTLQFDPETGFTAMSDYMGTMSQDSSAKERPRVNHHIATYKDGASKRSWTSMPGLSPQEKDEYSRGTTIFGAIKDWRAGGSIGVVTSSMSSASEQSQHENNWHTVAMARQGSKVWVHDPAYDSAAYAGSVKRVDGVPGTANVRRLIQQWPNVRGVYFQGPPSSYMEISGQMECMGRSAQWVAETRHGTLPWPPDSSSLGGQWTFHSRN
jgi:hypothetical protein